MIDFQLIFQALTLVLEPYNLLFITLGIALGVIVGAIPGFGASTTIAIVLPLTLTMNSTTAILFMIAVYVGSNYGSAIPAALINTPGTSGAAATVLDAYPMSKQGMAPQAIGISILASCIGGILGGIAMLLLFQPIMDLAFMFGRPEFFVLTVFALVTLAVALGDNLRKGLLSGFLGLLIAAIAANPVTGQNRLDMGFHQLYSEVPFIPILIGMFAFSELFYLIGKKKISSDDNMDLSSYAGIIEGFKIVISKPLQVLRAAFIGIVVGAIPGSGGSVANFVSWLVAKSSSNDPDSFGKGNPEGVIASETSNNSVAAGALIPTLTLAIPGSGTTAVILGAMFLHGLSPGPRLLTGFPVEANALILSVAIGNIVLFFFAFFISKYIVRVVLLPAKILVPSILVLTVLGTYILYNSMFHPWLMFVFGLLAYIMRESDYPIVPLVLAIIIGPIAESAFLQSMRLSQGDPSIFFQSTIAQILWILTFVAIFGKPLKAKLGDRILQSLLRLVR